MDVEFQMAQLVNLAIGSPEVGAVNFNLLQRVLIEMLKLTDLDSATVKMSAEDAARLGDATKSFLKSEEDEKHEEHHEEGSARRSGNLHQCTVDPQKIDQMLEDMNQLKFDVEDLTTKVATMSSATETVPFEEMRASLSQIDAIQEKVQKLEVLMEDVKDFDLGDKDGRSLGQRLSYLEKHMESHEDQLTRINSVLEDKLNSIEERTLDMEKEMGMINEKLTVSTFSSHMMSKKSQAENRVSAFQDQASNINNLISRLSSVQQDLDNLTEVTNRLAEEQEQRQMIIDVLTEQVDMLKMVKADKTNMEDILAAKADMSQVHRKVSHDHFDQKIDELNSMLEDAFQRLNVHEDMWQDEVDDLRVDIGNKLDKLEFSPLKDYVNEKLKMLQEKMKAIAAMNNEGPAAGTHKRIIRDVQCISCDNNSVMKAENTLEDVTPAPPLPAQQSVKPYLTYKLDQVRRQQKKLPGRNLLHFEEMLQGANDSRNRKSFQSASKSGDQLVNRYVGGSHTITTPQQRVTRTGNYFQTWGPVITAVSPPQQSAA